MDGPGGGDGSNGGGSNPPAGSNNGNGGGKPNGNNGGGGNPGPGTQPNPNNNMMLPAVECKTETFTDTRVWRLSDEQFVTAVNDLLGVKPPEISTSGRQKSQFVEFEERFHVDSALTADIRTSVETVANQAIADLPKLLSCPQGQAAEACADGFIDRFANRAFRRPVTAEEKTQLKALYTMGAADGQAQGIRLVISAVLQSGSFLYRTELGTGPQEGKLTELTPHELASSLSFLLLNSIPDQELLAAANDGSIMKPETFTKQVQRLTAMPRVQENLTRVMLKWVGLGDGINVDLGDAVKEFTPELKASMEEEMKLFFHNILTKNGTLSDVLTSTKGYVDARLAPLYGVSAPAGTGLSEVALPANQRAGILTQAAIISKYSHGHPVVFRGKYVRDELLCGTIPSPPDIPDIEEESKASANLSEREQSQRRLANPICGGCHKAMDPLGYAFLKYDPLARFHETENGQAIDTRGEISDGGDANGTFTDAVDMAKKLAGSKTVRQCIEQKMFQYALGRLYQKTDSCEIERIDAHLQKNGGKLSELIAGVVYSSAFRYRTGGK